MSQTAAPCVTHATTVYLVTGASRGIGFGLVAALAARPGALVFAGARDADKAERLQQLAKQHPHVRVLQLDATSDADHAAAVARVQAEAGRVDIVVANAAVALGEGFATTDVAPLELMQQHYAVNTVGPLRLFQHFFALLGCSSAPKFVAITSGVGSIGLQTKLAMLVPQRLAIYGSSKVSPANSELACSMAVDQVSGRGHLRSAGTLTLIGASAAAVVAVRLR